jgi:hypothetical protein
MRLGTSVTLVGIGLATIGFAAMGVGGCSSDDTKGGDTGNAGTVPPAKPSAPATTSTTEHNFALHQLFLGNAPRGGDQASQDANAWKTYGYNIDGKVTAKDSQDGCALVDGASKAIQVDGTGGIDNSFGQNILPIILTTAGSDAAKRINESINDGSFTVMIDAVGLDDTPTQTNIGLSGALFGAGKFSETAKPTWTKSDDWPVSAEFVTGGNVASPKIKFGDSYVVNGTWVNGSPADVTLSLAISGVTLTVTVHKAIMTFEHKTPGKADNGTIAGVINTEELISGLHGVAGSISTSLCSGSAFDSIAQQIRQASDIMADGTAGTSAAKCNAISIGLGFTADEIGKPTKAVESVPGPDKCKEGDTDAGTVDSGTDSGGTKDAAPVDAAKD